MFGLFERAVGSALDIVSDIFEGECPSKRNVAQLLDAGLTIAAIAQGFDVAESVIEELAGNSDPEGEQP